MKKAINMQIYNNLQKKNSAAINIEKMKDIPK